MQKHDNELNLLKSFGSFVYKFIELIQLLNPNKGEDVTDTIHNSNARNLFKRGDRQLRGRWKS